MFSCLASFHNATPPHPGRYCHMFMFNSTFLSHAGSRAPCRIPSAHLPRCYDHAEALACAEEAEVNTVQMNTSTRESLSSSEGDDADETRRSPSSRRKSGSSSVKRARKRSDVDVSIISMVDCAGSNDDDSTGAASRRGSRTTSRARSTRSAAAGGGGGGVDGKKHSLKSYAVVSVDDDVFSVAVGDDGGREGDAKGSGASSPSLGGSGSVESGRDSPAAAEVEQDTPTSSPPSAASDAHEDKDDDEQEEEEQEKGVAIAEPAAVARTRSTLARPQRKPLGNLAAEDVVGNGSGNNSSNTTKGKDVSRSRGRWADAGLEKAQPVLWREAADSESPKTRGLRERKERADSKARGENEHEKREKKTRAVGRREEKARCQETR